MPANPNRSNLEAPVGTRLMSAVLAQNVRAARRRRDLSQEQVAARMKQLAHDTWSRVAVSSVEKGARAISADELFSLSIVLSTPLPALCDPAGLEGENTEPICFGPETTVPAAVVHEWIAGRVRIEFLAPGSYTPHVLPGFQHVKPTVEKAMDEYSRLAAEERSKSQKRKRR